MLLQNITDSWLGTIYFLLVQKFILSSFTLNLNWSLVSRVHLGNLLNHSEAFAAYRVQRLLLFLLWLITCKVLKSLIIDVRSFKGLWLCWLQRASSFILWTSANYFASRMSVIIFLRLLDKCCLRSSLPLIAQYTCFVILSIIETIVTGLLCWEIAHWLLRLGLQ